MTWLAFDPEFTGGVFVGYRVSGGARLGDGGSGR